MKKSSLPQVGSRLEITLENVDENHRKILISQVMDIKDDETFIIATPIYGNVVTPIALDKKIKVTYFKKSLGVYGFKAIIIDRKKTRNSSYLIIKKLGEIIRVQRRDFYRLQILLDATIQYKGYKDEQKQIQVITKDISGGGLRILSKEKVDISTPVKINLQIGKTQITTKGKILRCEMYEASETSQYKFDIGIVFDDICDRSREDIISFIFEYQRKMIEKGLS